VLDIVLVCVMSLSDIKLTSLYSVVVEQLEKIDSNQDSRVLAVEILQFTYNIMTVNFVELTSRFVSVCW